MLLLLPREQLQVPKLPLRMPAPKTVMRRELLLLLVSLQSVHPVSQPVHPRQMCLAQEQALKRLVLKPTTLLVNLDQDPLPVLASEEQVVV